VFWVGSEGLASPTKKIECQSVFDPVRKKNNQYTKGKKNIA
jgi:hypothetical protein